VKISKQGREYREAVAAIVAESGLKKITGAVAVKRILYTPDWRRRDIDNTAKAIYDAISETQIWEDDSFIAAEMCEKRKSPDKEGRVILQIKSLVDGVIVKKAGAWLE